MELVPADNIKKIAILRANGLGDFIVTLVIPELMILPMKETSWP